MKTSGAGRDHGTPVALSEREVWYLAGMMLQEFGSEAEAKATSRAEEALQTNDDAGQAMWIRVIRSISAMTETEGETLH